MTKDEKKKKTLTKEEKIKSDTVKIDWQFEVLRTFLAIFISLAVVTVIVFFISDEPFEAIQSLLIGPFTTLRRFGNVIELMIPLTFTGLAITVVFRSKRFNLSADGTFYAGSLIAAVVGLISPFPPVISIIIAFIVALIIGGVIGYIPAIVQKKFGANELVTSLMLNYVVNYGVKYIFNYKIRDPQKSSLQSYPMPESFQLRNLIPGTRIHSGIVIMAVVVFIVWFILYRTRWGYSLRATGSNEKFAKYSGIKVGLVVILAQSMGTALASLGGAIEMIGLHKTFKWKENPGFGFDGVIISTLANGNPALVPLAAFFLSYVRVGADILNRTTQIPAEIVAIVQAIIILLVAAQAFLAKT
ncbi:MAG: ABC transporter permease, partial [Staphylococcus equorum]|nr:ABC transporter permease [Staphylococcus equorum]